MNDDLKDNLRKKAEDAFNLSYVDEAKLYFAWGVLQRKAIPIMKVWLTDFWTDPAKFTGALRAILVGLSGAVLSGQLVLPWPKATWFVAVFLPALAAGMSAGQKNQSPGTIKTIALDPTVAVTAKDVTAANVAKDQALS